MFCVYMILLRDFVPEWNSHPGTRTGVNSHPRDILWWYHVNKYRAMRGNRSELALRWKLPPVSCKHPLTEERVKMVGQWNLLSVDKRRIPQRHVFMMLSSLQTEIFLVKWQFFPEKSFIAERTGGHHDTYFTSKFLWMSAKNFSIDLSPTEFWLSGLTSVEKSCLCLWEDPQLNLTEKEKLLKLMRTNLKWKDNWGKVHNPAFFVFGAVERITNKFVLWIVSRRDRQTLQPLIEENIEKETMIFSDSCSVHHNLDTFVYEHQTVNHSV